MGVKVYHNNQWVDISGSSSASGGIFVMEENTTLSGIATTLKFVGTAVTATNESGNPSIKKIEISSGASNFVDLNDTPSNYTNSANKFVRVDAGDGTNGTSLIFDTQAPTTGAAGQNKQVQYNDGSTLQGADGLEFIKDNNSPHLILKPPSTSTGTYDGGGIFVQTNNISNTIDTPWNSAILTADGSLELFRSRTVIPAGGPYIDFKSQLDGNNNPVDMDARIQMDYNRVDDNGSVSLDPSGADYSAITFETGGNGHYTYDTNVNGRVVEKIRIGKNGEIGILAGDSMPSTAPGPYNNIEPGEAGSNNPIVESTRTDAQKYGTNGQVLMSGGKGSPVFWGTNGAGGNLWTQNSNGIYRNSDVMIRRTDNTNNASLAVHGVTNLSADVNSSKTVLDLRNINDNADCLTFHNIRLTQDTTTPPGWPTAAWRIQRRVDVTNQGYIQFGSGSNSQDEDLSFGSQAYGEKLRISNNSSTSFYPDGISDIILNAATGTGENTQVKGVINMGSSYKNGTHGVGSGHYSALKLFVYKDSNVNNVYGLGISNGMLEIQSNANIGFFAESGSNPPPATSGARAKRMTINMNGNIGAPSGSNIHSASDSRLKKNVVTLDKGLSEINSLRPVSFNWIDNYIPEETDTLYGFIAQEVQTVDSNLVNSFGSTPIGIGTDPSNPTQTITDPLRVDEKFIVPMLVKAVQELSAKNDALEARIAALEG